MGTQHQDVIEINGKKYDAVTGRLIVDQRQESENVNAKMPQPKSGVVLDGFVKRTHHADIAHAPASHHKKPVQKSQTLMRQVVKKPATQPLSPPKPVSKHQLVKPTLVASTHMQKSASEVKKNPFVSRYGDIQHRSTVVKKVQALEVKKPEQYTVSSVTPQISSHNASAVEHNSGGRSKATSMMLERGLANATSHELPTLPSQHQNKRKKLAHKLGISARAMAISTTVLAGVLLGGFFAIQNVPNLSMRVAAARAGFDASMPGYSPSGFSFKGPIKYSPGQVTISFDSNTDDREYTVTQRSTNWNSDALLSNYVVTSNKQYQTYLDRGRTLYIYDESNATWIDNGVWYQVEGNSDMTTDQLVRIASSI
ncbi:DUF4367 domain-containing protein [Candidatus Saccharibacteria bacterium]|nr:DUF4367 domain-containing protein [Candidatus Saccharibacteria bacterium]